MKTIAGIGNEHVDRGRDRPDVGARVEGVGDDERDHGRVEGTGIVLLEHAGQPVARHQADLGAHVLDGRHHRQHHKRGPERRVAVLGAGLRVGPDARGIVVRRAGDQAGPEDLEREFQRVPAPPGSQPSSDSPAARGPRSVCRGPSACRCRLPASVRSRRQLLRSPCNCSRYAISWARRNVFPERLTRVLEPAPREAAEPDGSQDAPWIATATAGWIRPSGGQPPRLPVVAVSSRDLRARLELSRRSPTGRSEPRAGARV